MAYDVVEQARRQRRQVTREEIVDAPTCWWRQARRRDGATSYVIRPPGGEAWLRIDLCGFA
ncbi:MAG: hypothetical protein M3387_06595 [Actinomycetota bacterium]|nr:hypothetical protein [Actinomycetota bacterium]